MQVDGLTLAANCRRALMTAASSFHSSPNENTEALEWRTLIAFAAYLIVLVCLTNYGG